MVFSRRMEFSHVYVISLPEEKWKTSHIEPFEVCEKYGETLKEMGVDMRIDVWVWVDDNWKVMTIGPVFGPTCWISSSLLFCSLGAKPFSGGL